MKSRLGRQEMQFLAYAQLRRLRTIRAGEMAAPLRLTRAQERELFRRLIRGRLIARVRPGLYLVPPTLPLAGSWTPNEALALRTLLADRRGRYQVCGPGAFIRYGFDNQVPSRIAVYNNRISGVRTIGAAQLILIKVSDRRLGDTESVRTADGPPLVYSSRARTLLDAVYDGIRFGTFPRAFRWIRAEISAGRVSPSELVRVTLRYGDVGTIRRIGAFLSREGIKAAPLKRLERSLKTSKGLIPWNPLRPKRGKGDRRWGVVWNDEA